MTKHERLQRATKIRDLIVVAIVSLAGIVWGLHLSEEAIVKLLGARAVPMEAMLQAKVNVCVRKVMIEANRSGMGITAHPHTVTYSALWELQRGCGLTPTFG